MMIFLKQCVTKFIREEKITYQEFRDEKLWFEEIRLIYTMNEESLRKLFKSFTSRRPNCNYMLYEDCLDMVLGNGRLAIDKL